MKSINDSIDIITVDDSNIHVHSICWFFIGRIIITSCFVARFSKKWCLLYFARKREHSDTRWRTSGWNFRPRFCISSSSSSAWFVSSDVPSSASEIGRSRGLRRTTPSSDEEVIHWKFCVNCKWNATEVILVFLIILHYYYFFIILLSAVFNLLTNEGLTAFTEKGYFPTVGWKCWGGRVGLDSPPAALLRNQMLVVRMHIFLALNFLASVEELLSVFSDVIWAQGLRLASGQMLPLLPLWPVRLSWHCLKTDVVCKSERFLFCSMVAILACSAHGLLFGHEGAGLSWLVAAYAWCLFWPKPISGLA